MYRRVDCWGLMSSSSSEYEQGRKEEVNVTE